MPAGRFVAYYRVSTDEQGRSGLGIEAQRATVRAWLNGGAWDLLAEFTEIETGKNDARPQLAAALAECRLTGARLIVSKVDRLSRNMRFLCTLRESDVQFDSADGSTCNSLHLGMMISLAQHEREVISQRTKDALAQAKKRRQEAGEPALGGYRGGPVPNAALSVQARQDKAAAFAARVAPHVRALRDQGMSLRQIAAALEARNVRTPRGGAWTAKAVSALLGLRNKVSHDETPPVSTPGRANNCLVA